MTTALFLALCVTNGSWNMGFFFTDEPLIFLMVDKACVTCHLALFDLATRELSTASGPGASEKGQLDLFSRSLT